MPANTRRGLRPMRPATLKPYERWNFGKPGWIYQLKYDGFRALLYKDAAGCSLQSKGGNDFVSMGKSFKALCQAAEKELAAGDIVLDGEVVVLDEEGKADFCALMEGKYSIVYAAFDILWLRGKDVRGVPLAKRLELLRREIPRRSSALLMIGAAEPDIAEVLFELVCRQGLEGLVAKRADSLYDPADKRAWVKVINKKYPLIEKKRAFFNRARAKKTARRI